MGAKDKERIKDNKSRANEEERSELDGFKEQQLVDDMPMEDLKIEQKHEKEKHNSQDASQSERKYTTNDGKDN
ncbi:hypothetical protein [Virgibacillus sediminis]